jgi:hypothetical protein
MTGRTKADDLLRRSIVCPNCWREFPPAQVRFIAESPRLVGDPVMGPLEPLRFRPMRFDASGNAIDPHDVRCNRMACPTCHIEFPRALLELRQVPISIVGAPGSGKTNLLAAGMWGLAQRAQDFGLQVVDADPAFNTAIHRNESLLFATEDPTQDVTLPKTDIGGSELYRTARIAGAEEMVPKPSFFLVKRVDEQRHSMMVLYDNAGEHFMPGTPLSMAATSTRHLERSSAIVMVFDPLQDHRFRQRYAPGHVAPFASGHERQELVFTEAVSRIRRLRGLDPAEPISIPIIVALTKADAWADAALAPGWSALSMPTAPAERRAAMARRVQENHERCAAAVAATCPEFLNAVRALASKVWLVPVSALGTSPAELPSGGFRLRAQDIRPQMPEMPFVLAMAIADRDAFPTLAA